MKKVLFAGVTSYFGREIIQEFKKHGFLVRALARNEAKLESLRDYIDESFIGEVTNPNSLRGICKDVDIVFSFIGITKQEDNQKYVDVDYQGNKNLLEEAKKEGISKFIYVSVFNSNKMKNLKGIQAKVRFEQELKKSGLDYSIVYPNGIFFGYARIPENGKKKEEALYLVPAGS